MGIILDIIVAIVLVLSIFLGFKKGLIGVVFNFCALIIAIVVTAVLFNPVTKLVIDNTDFDDNIKNTIIENGMLTKEEINEDDKSIDNLIQQYVTNGIKDAANNTIEKNAGIVAEKIVSVGVAICLFIVVRIGLILLKFLAEGLAELPIIKQFNEIGGLFYGLLRGIIVIYGLFALCFFIVSLTNSEVILNTINTSILSKFIYENNIILKIFF